LSTTVLSIFDKIYLINLKRRPDRLQAFYTNNARFIKDVDIEIFEAFDGNLIDKSNWKHEIGALGCWESHMELLRKIEKSDYERVLILEDDAIISNPAAISSETVINFVKNEKWDMFYFGFHNSKPPIIVSDHIQKLSFAIQTHAYAVNKNSVRKIIEYAEARRYWIDGVYGEMHSFTNCFSTIENAIIQTDSNSDISSKKSIIRQLYIRLNFFIKTIIPKLKTRNQKESRYYKKLFIENDNWNGKNPNHEETSRWNIIKNFIEAIKLNDTDSEILDLGCGRGWLANLLMNFGNVTAIEPVKAVAKYGKSLFPELNIAQGTSKKLIKAGKINYFDLIISSEVIEHIPDSKKNDFIKSIYFILKPGGHLIITSPRKDAQQDWLKYSNPDQSVENWLYEKDLEALFNKVGFKTLLLNRNSAKPFNASKEIEIYQLWLFKKV